jgi:serine phosphatase RsbU (regulator of sigma subunit)
MPKFSFAGNNDSYVHIQNDLQVGSGYLKNNPDSALFFFDRALLKAKSLKIDTVTARCYFLLGKLSFEKGDYFKSDSLYRLSESSIKKANTNSLDLEGKLFFARGSLQMKLGNFDKCVKHFIKAKEIFQKVNDTLSYDEVDMSIAIMYMEKDELGKAKSILNRLIREYSKVENDPLDISSTFGYIHYQEGNLDSAVYFFSKSLEYQRKQNNLDGVAVSHNNIGHALLKQKKYTEAKHQFEKSIEVYQSIHSKHGEAFVRNSLGQALYYLELNDEAIQQFNLSYQLSKKLGLKSFAANSTLRLSKIYAEQNDFGMAYEMLTVHKAYNDSSINESSEKSIQELRTKFDFVKQESEMSSLKEKQKANEEDKIKSRYIFNLMLAVILLVIVGMIFTAIAYKNNRKKNLLLEIKNQEIAQQNKEIKDSINYAKRIQKATLPPEHLIKSIFPDSFVFYLPKDIVSGDFYWLESISNSLNVDGNNKINILLAAADCTGHGVPGAMVSVVCNNALNRAVREYGLIDPGKILDKTREIVIQEFEKSETDVKDGMDISLINIEISNNEILKIRWAGANNPLWIIRNNELMDYRPDKQPIGKFFEAKPFTSHEISLQKGDSFYLFTDGVSDQFGGIKGKKMKIAGLKNTIRKIQHHSMNEQLEIIRNSFYEWKGSIEQLDDVCVIGVRI